MEMAGADVHGLLRSIAIDVDPATGFITSIVVEVNGDGHDLIVNGHHVPLPRIDQPFTVPQAALDQINAVVGPWPWVAWAQTA
jgi:hypothetical protein